MSWLRNLKANWAACKLLQLHHKLFYLIGAVVIVVWCGYIVYIIDKNH